MHREAATTSNIQVRNGEPPPRPGETINQYVSRVQRKRDSCLIFAGAACVIAGYLIVKIIERLMQ